VTFMVKGKMIRHDETKKRATGLARGGGGEAMNQTSQATNAVSEGQRGVRYRVLIVEDDGNIRELIRYNLAQEGFIVEEAADGAQALERVKRRVPDLMG